jgi:hypothetical protein
MQTKTSQTKTQKAVKQPKQEMTPLIKHNVAVQHLKRKNFDVALCVKTQRQGCESLEQNV